MPPNQSLQPPLRARDRALPLNPPVLAVALGQLITRPSATCV
jgi:hypothetical protein